MSHTEFAAGDAELRSAIVRVETWLAGCYDAPVTHDIRMLCAGYAAGRAAAPSVSVPREPVAWQRPTVPPPCSGSSETASAYQIGHQAGWEARDAAPPAAAPVAEPAALTFASFRAANVTRCLKWHPAGIESWSPSDWLTAVTGELGELASLLKMRNRERDGLPGNKFSPTDKMVADEIADVLTYLDLLAAALGVDLGAATVSKFNEVSERVGFPDRIPAAEPASAETHAEIVDSVADGMCPRYLLDVATALKARAERAERRAEAAEKVIVVLGEWEAEEINTKMRKTVLAKVNAILADYDAARAALARQP